MLAGWTGQGWGYSYGPACQWIHLEGRVLKPEGRKIQGPLELTVTYQLPDMAGPATLLTNYPLTGLDFKFFLAGFNEEIEGVLFISPMFFFAKEIVFRYWAKSADGAWQSPLAQSTFYPPRVPILDIPKFKKSEWLCHTGIPLDPLELREIPRAFQRRAGLGR